MCDVVDPGWVPGVTRHARWRRQYGRSRRRARDGRQRTGGGSDAGPVLACADQAGPGRDELLSRLRLDAGDYYLVVDNYDRVANGRQAVTVLLEDVPQPPANDGCAGAAALVLDGGVAVATGDTWGADNSNAPDAGPRCSPSAGATGRDVVFSFTVPPGPPQDVTVSVAAPAGGLEPVLHATRPCAGPTTELACTATQT